MNQQQYLPHNLPLKAYNRKIKRSFSIEAFSPPSQKEAICRICLESCPYLELCSCRGTSMVHVNCLKQYIAKGHGSVKSRCKCEICGKSYNLLFTKKCVLSCSNVGDYFKRSPLFSILFLIFTVLTFSFIGYCSYLNSKGQLDGNLQLVLLIIGVCMVIVLLVVLIRWVYLYLFLRMNVLVDILEAPKITVELTRDNLNDSQQHIK